MRIVPALRVAAASLLVAGVSAVFLALPASALVVVGGAGDGGAGGAGGLGAPSLSLSVNPSTGTTGIAVGASTITATLAGGYSPTGTIIFFETGPSATAPTNCALGEFGTAAVSNDGAFQPSAGFTPTTAGDYWLFASYGGDTNNTGAVSNCQPTSDQEIVVAQGAASPSISSSVSQATVALGSTLQDSATLSGTGTLDGTGSITFNLYGANDPTCSAVPLDTETVTDVTSDGPYATTTGYTADTPGTYQWVASFSGDGDDNAVSTACGDEPVTVEQATPSISTQVLDVTNLGVSNGQWSGAEVAGANASDGASVTGVSGVAPTGTMSFSFFQNGSCQGNPDLFSADQGLSDAMSGAWGHIADLAAGSYSFQATYSGDASYVSVTSACEPFSVVKDTPVISSALASENPAVLGETLQDGATLSGTSDLDGTGTITFNLYGPNDATCVGSPVETETVSDIANAGTYYTTTGYTANTAGTYNWVASFSGDGEDNAVSTACGGEQTVVIQSAPTLSSTPNVTTINLGPITPPVLTDTASLSGGFNPTGTITFTLYDTSDLRIDDTETIAVSGDGSYKTPTGYTLTTGLVPGVPGLYQWKATYSGDDNNTGVSDNSDPGEQVTVNDSQPTLTSTPSPSTYTLGTSSGPLKDTVVISGSYYAQGTLTFTLVYNGNTVDSETINDVNGNGSYTTPTGYTLPITGAVTGTYQWNAQYSGDVNNASDANDNAANEQVVVKGRPELTTTSMNIAKGNVTYGAETVQTINGLVTGVKGDGAPLGTVNVTYGPSATPLCSATLVPGSANTSTYKCALLSNTQLSAANYLTVRATFVPAATSSTSSNFSYTTSMSGPFSGDNFLVKKDATTLKVSLSPASVTLGAESLATFSVSLTTGNGEIVPNGESVIVKVGSTSCVVTLSAGKGTCFLANSALGTGSYSVSASYADDTNLSSSSASGPQLTVKKR
jgi:hypothetical protein